MILPPQISSKSRTLTWFGDLTKDSIIPSGNVVNNSTKKVWIVAGGKKWCLLPGESSSGINAPEADGVLLDGRHYLFDSLRTDLGGGQIHNNGAIKVCNVGTLSVHDSDTVDPEFIVRMDAIGFGPCNPITEWGGYKNRAWCNNHSGWDIDSSPVGRHC